MWKGDSFLRYLPPFSCGQLPYWIPETVRGILNPDPSIFFKPSHSGSSLRNAGVVSKVLETTVQGGPTLFQDPLPAAHQVLLLFEAEDQCLSYNIGSSHVSCECQRDKGCVCVCVLIDLCWEARTGCSSTVRGQLTFIEYCGQAPENMYVGIQSSQIFFPQCQTEELNLEIWI